MAERATYRDATDRMFMATLYSSNSEKIMRYTDEVRLPHTRRVFYSQMC